MIKNRKIVLAVLCIIIFLLNITTHSCEALGFISKPAQVTGVKVEVVDSIANVTWNKINGANGYEVQIFAQGRRPITYIATENTKKIERNYRWDK